MTCEFHLRRELYICFEGPVSNLIYFYSTRTLKYTHISFLSKNSYRFQLRPDSVDFEARWLGPFLCFRFNTKWARKICFRLSISLLFISADVNPKIFAFFSQAQVQQLAINEWSILLVRNSCGLIKLTPYVLQNREAGPPLPVAISTKDGHFFPWQCALSRFGPY